MDPFVYLNGKHWEIIYCCVCLKSIEKVKRPEMKDKFEFGEQLEYFYPLLDMIFDYLSDKDLDNVMQVKKSWAAVAERILRKRSKPCWVSCYQENGRVLFKDSGNMHFSNGTTAFIFFGKHYNLNEYISLHEEIHSFQQMKFVEYCSREIVSRNINFCVLTCPKVVSYFSQDIEIRNGSIFDTLFLPEIPGIKTIMFNCNFSKLKRNPALLETYIKPNEEVKCLLVFDESDIRSSIDFLFKIILKETTANEIALGGGITHGVKLFKNDPKLTEQIRSRHETFCIAFTKQKGEEPDFQAVSRVIEGNELTRRELNKELMELRKSIVMRSNSIGLRICCQAKRRKGKESLIFNAHFPNTPLFGVEVEGEVGWNSNLPQDKVAEQPESFRPKRCKVLYPKFQYEWSSIFVVITWGNIIEM